MKRRAEGISPTDEKLGEHEQPRSLSGVPKTSALPPVVSHLQSGRGGRGVCNLGLSDGTCLSLPSQSRGRGPVR